MTSITDDDLPRGWFLLPEASGRGFETELALEMPPGHYLKDVAVRAVAKDDASDDVLFQHVDEPDHWSVVHLTWIGKQEQSPTWPGVPFTGTLAAFRAAYATEGDSFTRPS